MMEGDKSMNDRGMVPLRDELAQLWPSEIADQYYCEYKVQLRRTHQPEVAVESSDRGPCLVCAT
jgi:hypothetical protein